MQDERFLNGCLVDGDSGTERRAKQRRRRALGAALGIEALVMAALAILPLMNTRGLPPQYILLPRIPFSGMHAARPAATHPRETSSPSRVFVPWNPYLSLAHVSRARAATEVSAPQISDAAQGMSDHAPGILHATGGTPVLPLPRPASPQIVRRSEIVQEGLLINRVQPQYPEIARVARISGTVELRAIIGRDGRVRSVEVLSGSPLLIAAAEAAVRQWRYRPTLLDGEAVEVETLITVRFVLSE